MHEQNIERMIHVSRALRVLSRASVRTTSRPLSRAPRRAGADNSGETANEEADSDGHDLVGLDPLIEEIAIDAYGDDERLWAFRQTFEDNVSVPCDGFVIGEPVLLSIRLDGNERRGLDRAVPAARMAPSTSWRHPMSKLPTRSKRGSWYLAAYREWMGLSSVFSTPRIATASRHKRQAQGHDNRPRHEQSGRAGGLVNQRIMLCVAASGKRPALVTLRADGLGTLAPGRSSFKPRKQWSAPPPVSVGGD